MNYRDRKITVSYQSNMCRRLAKYGFSGYICRTGARARGGCARNGNTKNKDYGNHQKPAGQIQRKDRQLRVLRPQRGKPRAEKARAAPVRAGHAETLRARRNAASTANFHQTGKFIWTRAAAASGISLYTNASHALYRVLTGPYSPRRPPFVGR